MPIPCTTYWYQWWPFNTTIHESRTQSGHTAKCKPGPRPGRRTPYQATTARCLRISTPWVTPGPRTEFLSGFCASQSRFGCLPSTWLSPVHISWLSEEVEQDYYHKLLSLQYYVVIITTNHMSLGKGVEFSGVKIYLLFLLFLTKYHTYQLPPEKWLFLIFRNLSDSISDETIFKTLIKLKFYITSITRL